MAMEENQTPNDAEAFKKAVLKFYSSATVTSVKFQKENNDLLLSSWPKDISQVPDTVPRRLIKLLVPVALYRFEQLRSRRLVGELIFTIFAKHPEPTALGIAESLKAITDRANDGSNHSAKQALYAVKWLARLLGTQEYSKLTPETKKILGSALQSAVFAVSACNSISKPNLKLMKKRLFSSMKKNSSILDDLAFILGPGDPKNLTALPLIGLIQEFLEKNGKAENSKKYADGAIEIIIQQFLGSKTTLGNDILQSSEDVVKTLNRDQFSSKILPVLKKGMLRSPEVSIYVAASLLEQLKIDLSPDGMEIIKQLSSLLTSKEDVLREKAENAISSLAKRCCDPDCVKEMINYMFGVLNGSQGKITVAAHKIAVISSITALSFHGVGGTDAVQQISDGVVDHLLKLLKDEQSEGILLAGIEAMGAWASKYKNRFPEKLTNFFKEAISGKKTLPSAKLAYLDILDSCYATNTLSNAMPLSGILIDVMESGIKGTALPEAISATNFLLRLCRIDVNLDAKLGKLWSQLQGDEGCFASHKFISTADEKRMKTGVKVMHSILSVFSDKLPTDAPFYPQHLLRGLLLALTFPRYTVRKFTGQQLKSFLHLLEGPKFAKAMFNELSDVLDNNWLFTALNEINVKINANGGGDAEKPVLSNQRFGKLLIEAITVLFDLGADIIPINLEEVALTACSPCSHEHIRSVEAGLWAQFLLKYKISPETFVKNVAPKLVKQLKTAKLNASIEMISTLSTLSPETVWDSFVVPGFEALPRSDLARISEEAAEVAQTPEGVLCDQEFLQKLLEENTTGKKPGNMKRESKAYSYKDQLWELELRKELEAKRRKEGKEAEKQLNGKQKAALAEKLKEESLLRQEVVQLTSSTDRMLQLLISLVDANQEWILSQMPKLIDLLLPFFKYQIVSSTAATCWLKITDHAFSGGWYRGPEYFGELLGNCTLRMCKSLSGVRDNWMKEPLAPQATRCMDMLIEIAKTAVHEEGLEELGGDNRMPSESFSSCLPLLRGILSERPSLFSDNREAVQETALDFIKLHIASGSLDKYDIVAMPIPALFQLFLDLIANSGIGMTRLGATKCMSALVATLENFRDLPELSLSFTIMLDALLHPNEAAREHSLKALLALLTPGHAGRKDLVRRVWVARFDSHEECETIADEIWEKFNLNLPEEEGYLDLFLEDVCRPQESIREAAAKSIAEALEDSPDLIEYCLQKLALEYHEAAAPPPPAYDEFGRVIVKMEDEDPWEARAGMALTLKLICKLLPASLVDSYFDIIVPEGLSDRHHQVRDIMLTAAVEGLTQHGENHVETLLPRFEKELDELPNDRKSDLLRQSVVVLLGTLAQHLDSEDPKIRPIVAKLIESLSTPSQQVQEAVATCLPPLVPAIKKNAEQLVSQLLSLLLCGEQYGERRGAAYGLAGLVKGLGIVSLRKLDIMAAVQEAVQNKKEPKHREGALLALEMFSSMLGKLFEPYIVQLLPYLLTALGDHDTHVRGAAEECARVVMEQLSAHGVKLVLPSLLRGLDEDSWRTKSGSVELLGKMAYCAPKQLSSCLPSIVPKLIEVLGDSHVKVVQAGVAALKQIGGVIRNPEVQAISPTLLAALEDPSGKTSVCLKTLLKTQFIHYIDAPSLALIMPVIKRAFDDRSAETRRMAAAIIGNIYSLTDQQDVEPYLQQLIPGLKKSLVDPGPDVRAVSAKALGAIVGSASGDGGEELQKELLPWLKSVLISDTTTVDRAGAAQGLAEIFGKVQPLEKIMPDIINTLEMEDLEAYVRDGYLMLYSFLPGVYGEKFVPYLPKIIPSILQSLADESEYVRDTALKAGQKLIASYTDSAIHLLLPQLERGLFNDNWRIRYSSTQLMGDFLFRITGVTGKMTTEGREDETFGTETAAKNITEALGEDQRNNVLAGLYIARSDIALLVRQASSHIWKVIVSNTPRTIKEILPVLFQLLLGCLASSSNDKQQIAARCLGELVKKMGDRILVDVVPVLEEGLKSTRADQRKGVCLALSEIMGSTNKDMVVMYAENLIPSIRTALQDELPEVRSAAALTFSKLLEKIGSSVLEDALIPLVGIISNPAVAEEQGFTALEGIKEVVQIDGTVVLPFLIPKLTAAPVNTLALSKIAAASGEALYKHLDRILNALLSEVAAKDGDPDEVRLCLAVILAVSDVEAVRTVLEQLLIKANGEANPMPIRMAAAEILSKFVGETSVSLKQFMDRLLQGNLSLYACEEPKVVQSSVVALGTLVKSLDQREQLDYVQTIRSSVNSLSSRTDSLDNGVIRGFKLPKGLQPVLTILREGVLTGGPDLKEMSANTLNVVITFAEAPALKPHVVNVTGPLIRILGDRYSPTVKIAILSALALLLEKVNIMLKPFLPQLQSTFVKALQEPSSRGVRLNAGAAMARLIVIHPKPDAVTNDLVKNGRNSEDSAIQETFLVAIRGVLERRGEALTKDTVLAVNEFLLEMIDSDDDSSRIAAGSALGALVAKCKLEEDFLETLIKDNVFYSDSSTDWCRRHGSAIAGQVALKLNAERIISSTGIEKLRKCILGPINDDKILIIAAGLRSACFLLVSQLKSDGADSLDTVLLSAVARSVNHHANEVKQLAGGVIQQLGLAYGTDRLLPPPVLKVMVPMMVNGTKEKNSAVRFAAEEALLDLLALRSGDSLYKTYLETLDAGQKTSLSEVQAKNLAKSAKLNRSNNVTLDSLDDTVQI